MRAILRASHLVGIALLATGSCGSGDGVAFLPGTAELPDCTEAPAFDLNGTVWFDTGEVTVLTDGCPDVLPGDVLPTCALQWVFTQDGREVSIEIDYEYRLEARLCGDQLHLRGGWWLPFPDDLGRCTYADADGEEVRIDAEGSVLTVREVEQGGGTTRLEMAGTLRIRSTCSGDYAVTLNRL